MDETPDPGRCRELMDGVEGDQDAAMLESRRRVTRPRATDSHHERRKEDQEPPEAEPLATPRGEGAGREAHGGQHPHEARLDIECRGKLAVRPARVSTERGHQDTERGRLRDGDADGGERNERPQPAPHRRRRAVRRGRPEDEQREGDTADGDSLAREGQAAQDDVNERGHAVR